MKPALRESSGLKGRMNGGILADSRGSLASRILTSAKWKADGVVTARSVRDVRREQNVRTPLVEFALPTGDSPRSSAEGRDRIYRYRAEELAPDIVSR